MPLLYWALQTKAQTAIAGGFTIVTTSDVPCHMWLRHTLETPRKHAKPIWRRGLQVAYDARFCFVVFFDLEQNEPGDTLIHTFTWLGWVVCQTRWFYFWATSSGEPMHSTSPIFQKHYTFVPVPTTVYLYPDANPETTSFDGDSGRFLSGGGTWANIHDGAGTNTRDLHDTMMPCYIQALTNPGQWRLIWRNEILFDGSVIPPASTIQAAELSICGYNEENGLGAAPAINVYSSDPLSNVGASTGDYTRFGSTPLCDTPITWAMWVSSGFEEKRNRFELNAAGLAAVIPGSITKLAVLEVNYDVANIAPPPGPGWKGSGSRPGQPIRGSPSSPV